jgi:hypothetical protein
MPAPISSPTGTSLWSATLPDSHAAALAPAATTADLPFSALLRQALEDVASWDAVRERGKEAPLRTILNISQTGFACGPPALDVPRTQLAHAVAPAGKEVRQLSAAEIWLGAEPSD